MAKDNETPLDAIDAGKAQGGATATGVEAGVRSGAEDEHFADHEKHDSIGAEADKIKPDYVTPPGKNVGAQNEPAEFVTNGSVPPMSVASNSGFVPVAAVTTDPDRAEELVEARKTDSANQYKTRRTSRKRLSDEDIDKMGGAELRAVATDRGYEVADTLGTRGVRSAFARAQADDKDLEK